MKCAYFDAERCRSCSELATAYAVQLAAKDAHCRGLLDPSRRSREGGSPGARPPGAAHLDSRLRGNDEAVSHLDSRLRGNDEAVSHLDSRLRGNDEAVSHLDSRLRGNDEASLARGREPGDVRAVQWLPPVPSPESAFRNKAKMVVSGTAQAPVLGILDAQGGGVDLSDCPLYPPALQAAFAPLAEFIRIADIAPYDLATRRGELKYLLITLAAEANELMVRFVLRSQEPVQRMRKHLAALQAALPSLAVVTANLQPVHAALLEGEQEIVLTPRQHITMRLNGIPLHLGPRSFFQTNDTVAAALYRQAREWVDEIDPPALWDLFCGVGGFALHCAHGRRHVTGIETSADAIASAQRSAAELGLANVEFRALDAADFALGAARVPPLVIVNPPRRGTGAALAGLLEASDARWIVYSSCNAESLARDIAAMPGFRLRRARVLDMFPHTKHYEVLTLLERVGTGAADSTGSP